MLDTGCSALHQNAAQLALESAGTPAKLTVGGVGPKRASMVSMSNSRGKTTLSLVPNLARDIYGRRTRHLASFTTTTAGSFWCKAVSRAIVIFAADVQGAVGD